ncbi:hypothetical protein ES705_06817 [subsurface metagenome]
MTDGLKSKYVFAKNTVIENGYASEINWQSNVRVEDLNESTFLRELAWVVLSSGFKEKVVRNIFHNISECFFHWKSANLIVKNKTKCFHKAIKFFRNTSKVSAIINGAERVRHEGFTHLKQKICEAPLETLQAFPFVGPITVYHLAKNIGLPVAKPDRHLLKIANTAGFADVQEFCSEIARQTGDTVPVVDIVLWRFAVIERDYLHILFSDVHDSSFTGDDHISYEQ